MESHALGSDTASVRLTGTPSAGSGTAPVRTRHAQPVLAFTSAASDRQHSRVGGDPLLLLLVRKLKHGVKLVSSDAVHDAAPAGCCCPDATGTAASSAVVTSAAADSSLIVVVRLISPIDDRSICCCFNSHAPDGRHNTSRSIVFLLAECRLAARCCVAR